ncbi:MAG: ABC transporter permease [Flavitalea sp.]
MLNIIGLSTGIVFALLIGAYVWNEMQVNEQLHHAKNQYFLESEWKDPNLGLAITTLGPLAKRLKEDYPNLVANYYRWDGITSVISKGNKHFREGIQLGDSTLLSMYGFELQHGDARTALINPYSVVITPDKAIKYFGKTDVVGETITIQSFSGTKRDFSISGVLQEIPENSVTNLNEANHNGFFIPANTASYFGRDLVTWANFSIPSYIELKNGVSIKSLEKPIKQLIDQNTSDIIKQNLTVHPVALTDYYLQKDNGLVKRMLYTLSFVGVFILMMAIVNFINISISSSSARIKEIGIRKVLGGLKNQIIIQFLTESVILTLLSTILAVMAYSVVQPFFGELVGKEIPNLTGFPLYFIFIPVALVFLIGILAGLYPAIILSSLKSADSIKGKLKSIKENVLLRKSLTGFQFCTACIVMISAFIVSQQVAHFFSRNLGYNKEYIVSSQVPRDWSVMGVKKMETIRSEFAAMPEISEVTLSYEIPNGMNAGQPTVYKAGTDSSQAIAMQSMQTDGNYLSVYQIPLKAGAFFSSNAEADSLTVILNEKAVQALGWRTADDAIGHQLKIPGSNDVFIVKGVTENFHFSSMQEKIPPSIFFKVRFTSTYRYLSFKIKPGNIANAIAAIEKKWAILLTGSSFEYSFMDDTLKQLYKTEIQLKKAAYTATILSLIIVLLGVLGLVSLSIQKRTKEIGIRKVLGASVKSIIILFMKEVLIVITIAGLVACPIAWFTMRGWLSDYASRISLNAMPFIISVAGLVLITAILITAQTIKAGFENPVKSLRTE